MSMPSTSAVNTLETKTNAVRAAFLVGAAVFIPDLISLLLGQSITILAGFVKTTAETVATLFAWLSLRKLAAGRTHQYNYGYGKLENLVSLGVAAVMVLSFAVVVGLAFYRVLNPAPVGAVWLGLLIATLGCTFNLYFWRHNYRLAQIEPSPIIDSQWRLYRIKSIANLCTIATLGLSMLLRSQSWSFYLDPLGSLILAGFLLTSAYHIATNSVYDLLDRTLDEALQLVIVQELAAYFDHYVRFHGVRSRRSGSDVYVELLLEFDPEQKMREVQRVIDLMQQDLQAKIKNSQVSIVPTSAKVSG